MNIQTNLRSVSELTDEERAALRSLATAVDSPEVEAAWPGRLIEWATRQPSVIVWNDTGGQALMVASLTGQENRFQGVTGCCAENRVASAGRIIDPA